jgi:hypothetical protein
MTAQTAVFQAQLGAQVWPYLSVTEGVSGDTAQINVSNDGLGPAVLGSMTARYDGVPQSSFVGIIHAMLGPHLVARTPHGEQLGFTIDTGERGGVVRPGDHTIGLSLTSKRFAPQFLKKLHRLSFRICYCAIIPGKCWLRTSGAAETPAATSSCPAVPNDLLHSAAMDEAIDRNI